MLGEALRNYSELGLALPLETEIVDGIDEGGFALVRLPHKFKSQSVSSEILEPGESRASRAMRDFVVQPSLWL